jgi:hypothetical protein
MAPWRNALSKDYSILNFSSKYNDFGELILHQKDILQQYRHVSTFLTCRRYFSFETCRVYRGDGAKRNLSVDWRFARIGSYHCLIASLWFGKSFEPFKKTPRGAARYGGVHCGWGGFYSSTAYEGGPPLPLF